jgi:hypothetical protein
MLEAAEVNVVPHATDAHVLLVPQVVPPHMLKVVLQLFRVEMPELRPQGLRTPVVVPPVIVVPVPKAVLPLHQQEVRPLSVPALPVNPASPVSPVVTNHPVTHQPLLFLLLTSPSLLMTLAFLDYSRALTSRMHMLL